ncbi:unnamed protein product [Hapterophycus canaliculatus]
MLGKSEPADDETAQEDEKKQIADRGFELEDYRPETAAVKNRLDRIVQLKSINPLFGVFLADQLAIADEDERIAVLESVLDVPGTVARFTRMPRIEDMPPGTLATTKLDPLLLQRGLATIDELGGGQKEEEEEVENKGFGRVMFDEPKVWPLTIGEKCLRLFRDDYPKVDDVRVRPVWIVGELMQFDGNFDRYVVTRKLQKEEGILFRHCLRMILLLDEMANIPPEGTTVETWEDWLDDLADRLTETCRQIDPQSTDEVLLNSKEVSELPLPSGRRNRSDIST